MKQRFDELNPRRLYVPEDMWIDLEFKGNCIVSGKSITCRDLTIHGDILLIGNLFCNDIDIKGDCIVYGNIYSCGKVKVQGDLSIYTTSKSINNIEGGLFSPYGDVEVGGNLTCMHRIRAGGYQIKVGGDVITRDTECKTISVAGDYIGYPVGLGADERVYVLGDITTGTAIEAKEVFCGGKYTRKLYFQESEDECAKIHEHVQHWSKLT